MNTEDEEFQKALTTTFECGLPTFLSAIQSLPIDWESSLVVKSEIEDMSQWHPHVCGRCYDDVPTAQDLYPATCSEKPELLIGQPIGMYHCPGCGAMLMAGCKHPTVCIRCLENRHPAFD